MLVGTGEAGVLWGEEVEEGGDHRKGEERQGSGEEEVVTEERYEVGGIEGILIRWRKVYQERG